MLVSTKGFCGLGEASNVILQSGWGLTTTLSSSVLQAFQPVCVMVSDEDGARLAQEVVQKLPGATIGALLPPSIRDSSAADELSERMFSLGALFVALDEVELVTCLNDLLRHQYAIDANSSTDTASTNADLWRGSIAGVALGDTIGLAVEMRSMDKVSYTHICPHTVTIAVRT